MVRGTLESVRSRTEASSMPRLTREDGQAIVEYGMVIAGMSLVLITFIVLTGFDQTFADLVNDIENAFP